MMMRACPYDTLAMWINHDTDVQGRSPLDAESSNIALIFGLGGRKRKSTTVFDGL